jgi:hypothetical protein
VKQLDYKIDLSKLKSEDACLFSIMDATHTIECLKNRLMVEFQIRADIVQDEQIQQVMKENNWTAYRNSERNGWVPVKRFVKSR